MNLYQDDYPSWVDSLMEDIAIIEKFELSSDEDIWDTIKESSNVPHVGNLYCLILLGEAVELLSEKYENHEFAHQVNAMATTFTVNGESINSHEDMIKAIEDKEPLSLSEFVESNLGKKQLYAQYVEYIVGLDLENVDTDALLAIEHKNLFGE